MLLDPNRDLYREVRRKPAIVNAVVFPLLFVSNVFIPIAKPPAALKMITGLFPVGHLAAALQQAFFPGPHSAALPVRQLLIMGAWGVAGLVLALRFFSWEPANSRDEG